VTHFLSRQERFAVVGSTNDVVRTWLAEGTPEVPLAVAEEQSAGRGRDGRSWHAPPRAALLLSLGFRPTWLQPDRTWRLGAIVSMAMAEAGEAIVGAPAGSIRLKWPNDLVVESVDERLAGASPSASERAAAPPRSHVRKIAGVLGESEGLGTDDPRVVIGIGINGDWPAGSFPADLAGTMISLRALAGDAPIDHEALLEAFLEGVERELRALRGGEFDEAAWARRQVTTGREVDLIAPDRSMTTARALDVDASTGALVVEDRDQPGGRRAIVVGEVRHVRVAAGAGAAV
jgi:BirA family biotin operon repressor/biotin-[acetyl-CoA-carboxylase] ligase